MLFGSVRPTQCRPQVYGQPMEWDQFTQGVHIWMAGGVQSRLHLFKTQLKVFDAI